MKTLGYMINENPYCIECSAEYPSYLLYKPIMDWHEFDDPIFCSKCGHVIDVTLSNDGYAEVRDMLLEQRGFFSQLKELFKEYGDGCGFEDMFEEEEFEKFCSQFD